MNKEELITFYLWQKMSAKGNLFSDFLNGKVEKDKKAILDKWNQAEKLLDEISEELGWNK